MQNDIDTIGSGSSENKKSGFESDLQLALDGDSTWKLTGDLKYHSQIAGDICVPKGFKTDLASVPRVPMIYEAWGNRAHRESVVHDFLYCTDCPVPVSFMGANRIFLEAMESRGVSWWIRYPMFWAVCACGYRFFHKRLYG